MDTPGSVPVMRASAATGIPSPGFKTARRGFDQQQVLEYVKRLADRVQTVENLERHLRSEAEQVQLQRDVALRERDAVVEQRDALLRERDAALRDRTSAEAATYEQVSGSEGAAADRRQLALARPHQRRPF